ncbi:MAG: hypothetical protein MHM6MM_002887 [Cercozoa sp. M6MM]
MGAIEEVLVVQPGESVATSKGTRLGTRIIWQASQCRHVSRELLPSFEDHRILEIAGDMCFPDIQGCSASPQTFCFVLTDAQRVQRFGFVARMVSERLGEVAVCVLTSVAAFGVFTPLSEHLLERFVFSQMSCATLPLLLPVLEATRESVPCRLVIPKERCGESLVFHAWDAPLNALLMRLEANKVLALLSALLCEWRVVFVSDHVHVSNQVLHGVMSLLAPFEWAHQSALPLPHALPPCAPMPLVMAVTRAQWLVAQQTLELDDLLVVDCDQKTLRRHRAHRHLIELPSFNCDALRCLRSAIVEAQRNQRRGKSLAPLEEGLVRRAAVTYMLCAVGDWRRHVAFVESAAQRRSRLQEIITQPDDDVFGFNEASPRAHRRRSVKSGEWSAVASKALSGLVQHRLPEHRDFGTAELEFFRTLRQSQMFAQLVLALSSGEMEESAYPGRLSSREFSVLSRQAEPHTVTLSDWTKTASVVTAFAETHRDLFLHTPAVHDVVTACINATSSSKHDEAQRQRWQSQVLASTGDALVLRSIDAVLLQRLITGASGFGGRLWQHAYLSLRLLQLLAQSRHCSARLLFAWQRRQHTEENESLQKLTVFSAHRKNEINTRVRRCAHAVFDFFSHPQTVAAVLRHKWQSPGPLAWTKCAHALELDTRECDSPSGHLSDHTDRDGHLNDRSDHLSDRNTVSDGFAISTTTADLLSGDWRDAAIPTSFTQLHDRMRPPITWHVPSDHLSDHSTGDSTGPSDHPRNHPVDHTVDPLHDLLFGTTSVGNDASTHFDFFGTVRADVPIKRTSPQLPPPGPTVAPRPTAAPRLVHTGATQSSNDWADFDAAFGEHTPRDAAANQSTGAAANDFFDELFS